MYVNTLNGLGALARSCDPGSSRSHATLAPNAELPEQLADTQEGAKHRPGIGVVLGSKLPARDLFVEGCGERGSELATRAVGRQSRRGVGETAGDLT